MFQFFRKYRIVTGITQEYLYNPANPKYYAKYVNDDIMCYGNTESEAIERLKELYLEYKKKRKIYPFFSNKVIDASVSIVKFEKHFGSKTYTDFFELLNKDPNSQIDDEFTIEDLELSKDQIELINSQYQLNVQPEDFLVDLFEEISKK